MFHGLNPKLSGSLTSWAERGANFWVRITGVYPKSCKLKTKEGKVVGEWRADGNQTVISGIHPSGKEYRNNAKRPVEIEFQEIVWPGSLILPWTPPEPEPQRPSPGPSDTEIHKILCTKCGPPYHLTERGAIVVNQSYFVQRFCMENLVLFERDEDRFHLYDAATGTWEKTVADHIKAKQREDWERLTHVFGQNGLAFKASDSLLNSLVSGIKSHSGRIKVFKRLRNVIHCKNGMLHLEADGSWRLMPFSPEYYSRNPIPINWNPEAACPKFREFLSYALNSEDAALFIRWFGSVLITGNAAQRILLFIGKAMTGKSTIAEVVELVIGWKNTTALRTALLHERFEIGRLAGFTLLTAKDVPGEFLQEEGAQSLKKLVGHDYIPGEIKGVMDPIPIYGDFGCLITCNERLIVRLQGDTDVEAWRRRLMILEFLNTLQEEQRMDNYAQLLFAEEAEGILALAVNGAVAHLAELTTGGNFKCTSEQKARVDRLLAESESVKYFVTDRVQRIRGGGGLSTEELVSAYNDYCDERDWRALGIKAIQRQLPDLMMTIHGVHLGANIVRAGKRVRGYPHVTLNSPSTEREPNPEEFTL